MFVSNDFIKHFHPTEVPLKWSSTAPLSLVFFSLLRNCINCVHNCAHNSSLLFIPSFLNGSKSSSFRKFTMPRIFFNYSKPLTSHQIYCVWCCADQHQVLAESRVQVQIWILNLGDPPNTKERNIKGRMGKAGWEIPRSLLTITFRTVLVFCFVFSLNVGGAIV